MTSIETLLFGRGIRSLKPGLLIYNEVREHGAPCSPWGALKPPQGEPTETDTGIMGLARQAPTAAPGGLVEAWQAQRQEQGEDAFDQRLPIAKERTVRGVGSNINRDGPVCSGLFGRSAHGLPLSYQVSGVAETRGG